MIKKMAWAILAPIFSGLLLGIGGMYTDLQGIKAREPEREKQMDRIERKVDKLIDFHLDVKGVNILKRGTDAKEGR